MRELKKRNLVDFKESWTSCAQCAGCYYRGPIVPHNWRELPPPAWSSPLHKCPSFEYYKFRAYTAVGRGNLASIVFDNDQFPITDDLVKILYTCATCGMCSEICKAEQPLTAILALKEELVRRGIQRPDCVEELDANVREYGNVFRARRLPRTLEEIPNEGENIYFAGCTARFREPAVAEATVEVLTAAGVDIASLAAKEKCCGFVAGHDGNTWLLEEKAAENVKALEQAGAKRVVVSCAQCYKTLKLDYPLIVGTLPFEVVHVSQLLAELIDKKKLDFEREIARQVTYHDPCFLGRQCKVYEEPRKVLESIPGIKLVEMERNRGWSYCCGSGAKITSSCYPEFTAATTKDRLLEGRQAANTIVTACTTCFSHMSRAAVREQMQVQLYDLPVIVAEAMGLKSST